MSAFSLVGPSLAVAGHAARALSAYRTLREAPAEADALLAAIRAIEGPMFAAAALHARERTAGIFDGALALARDAVAGAESLLAGGRPGGSVADDDDDNEGAGGWTPWLERAIHGVRRRDALPRALGEIKAAEAALSLAFAAASALFGPLAPLDPHAPYLVEQTALDCAFDLSIEFESGRRRRIVLGAGQCFALLGSTVKKPSTAAVHAHGARAWSAQGRHVLLLEAQEAAQASGGSQPGCSAWCLSLHPLEGQSDGDGASSPECVAAKADAPTLALLRALGEEPLVVLPLSASALRVRRRPLVLACLPAHAVSHALPAALAAATPTYTFEPLAAEADSGCRRSTAGRGTIRRAGSTATAFALVFESVTPPAGMGAEGAERALGMRWPFHGNGTYITSETVDALLAIGLCRTANAAGAGGGGGAGVGAGSGGMNVDLESADGRRQFVATLRTIGDYGPLPEEIKHESFTAAAEEKTHSAPRSSANGVAESPRTPRASSPLCYASRPQSAATLTADATGDEESAARGLGEQLRAVWLG